MTTAIPDAPSPWLRSVEPRPVTAPLTLFCFPHAGGGGWSYRRWPEHLPGVELCTVELPGRGTRMREMPLTRLPAMVLPIAAAIRARAATQPFAFFGHSMGALIAFEVARQLRRECSIQPVHLFVAGREAPQIGTCTAPRHALPDEDFIESLRRLNGTPAEVLESPELMQLLLPLLRADFELTERYEYRDEAPLPCAITAFGGAHDATVPAAMLDAWREQTAAEFTRHMFEGDHFFVQSGAPAVLCCLRDALQPDGTAMRPEAITTPVAQTRAPSA